MATVPDVRVRLSAEGVAEVVSAFRRVQDEATRAQTGMAKFGRIAAEAKNVLVGLGAIKIGHAFADMVRDSVDLADSMGKLNQKTGMTVETLSTLSFAARTADLEQEQLNVALIKFARAMDEYDRGAKDARGAVRGLFGDAKALMGLNQDQRFLKIADALSQLEPGARRTALAIQFFGRSGAELLPLIDDLGNGGFDRLREKAQKLGLVVDRDLARAAQQAKDSLTDLKSAAQGMAMQFASGLAPAITNAANALSGAVTGDGINGFRKLGEMAGEVLKWIAAGFHTVAQIISTTFSSLVFTAQRLAELAADIMHGRFKSSLDRLTANLKNDIGAVMKTAGEQYWRALLALNRAPAPEIPGKRDTSSSEDEEARRAGERSAKENARRLEQERRAELELADVRRKYAARQSLEELKAQEAIEAERYEQGLTSLQQYYAARLELARRQGEIEAGLLYAKIQELQDQPLAEGELPAERLAKVLSAASEYEAKVVENETNLKRLRDEEARETEALRNQALEYERKIREAQADRFEASRAAIEEEARALDDLLRRLGTADTERIERVSAFRAAGLSQVSAEQQQADFEKLRQQADAALNEIELRRRQIEREVQTGQLFAFEGEQKIMDLERARLPLLEQIAQAMREAAVTPEQIQAAEEFQERIEELAASSDRAALEMAAFKQNIESSLTSSLSNWLSQGITQAESFADAFRSMALSVVQSLQQIAAQMLATMVIQKMLGFFGFASGGLVTTPEASGAGSYAAGGLVRGPGTSTSDSIPARLSNYEYVVRAAVVRRPGMLELLDTINYGTPRVRRLHGHRFAEGGLVTTPEASGSRASLSATIGLDEGLLLKRLEASPEFHRLFVRTAHSNQKAMKRALGG